MDPQPLLDAIAAIPETDLSPVLAAIASIPAVDLAPVLAAIAAIPTTDVAAALAAYDGATADQLSSATTVLLGAIAAIPPVDLQPVLAAVAAIPQTDLTPVLDAVAAIPPVDLQPVLDAVAAIPPADFGTGLGDYEAATTGDVHDARDAVNAHTDLSLTALAAALQPSGTIQRFARADVPANYSVLPGTDYVPAGGIVIQANGLQPMPFMPCNYAWVASGSVAGLWRYRGGSGGVATFQRCDLETATMVGSIYSTVYTTAAGSAATLQAVGKFIYYWGFTTSGNVATNQHYRLDTETGISVAMAPYPKTLTQVRSVRLNDGRFLSTGRIVGSANQTSAAASFFIYDPATNATPIEVVVALPIARFYSIAYQNPPQMALMPDGTVLLHDCNGSSGTNLFSCILTVTGNTISVGPAVDVGTVIANQDAGGYPLATGYMLPGYRQYVHGSGWQAAAQPASYGNHSAVYCAGGFVVIPGVGILSHQAASTIHYAFALFTKSPSLLGTSVVDARKN